ncbi:methyltransferase, FxLD system [Nonomuraea insulae]|uniref:Protein-L-isoaspartate O-methyltransferase n=1 Tax=Nonomuraea insulae TaxID=1616787 RepID=A0ABW1CQU6_9ACTN
MPTPTETVTSESAQQLRSAMVAALLEQGSIRRPEVAAAFLKVPREVFGPEATSLKAVYAVYEVIRTRFNDRGRATSSVSAPWLQAQMIEAARIGPGDRVLEIGSGGYNAAVISEIVGPEGHVVTVDIDPWVCERATRFLAGTGYTQVQVVLGDAEHAVNDLGPFDAILVTVGVWDCPWAGLLAPGGRLVVPLIFKSTTRSITFVQEGDRLVGHDPTVCGFVPLQGEGAHRSQEAELAGGAVSLTIDGGAELDEAALNRALEADRTELWTGVTVDSHESFETLNLWIVTEDDLFGHIYRDPASECALVRTAARWFCPALIAPDSFAYLTAREAHRDDQSGKVRHEFGIYGHGPQGADLADRLHEHVLTWDRDWRHRSGPCFTLYPVDAAIPEPAVGRVFRKRHTQLLMQWLT